MAGSLKASGRGSRMAIAVLIAASVAMHAMASSAQNDAGSGGDAPDAADKALRLKSLGKYQGNLSTGDARDWYKFKATGRSDPVCLVARLTTTAGLHGHFAGVAGTDVREVQARIHPDRIGIIGIASAGFDGAFFNASYEQGTSSRLAYNLTMFARGNDSLGTPDAGSGKDAGDQITSAMALGDYCIGGQLDPASGDTKDLYRFSGQAGDRIMVSLADTTGTLKATVRTAAGELLGTTVNGDFIGATLATSGDYYISVVSGDATPSMTMYTLALCSVDCGPPERPCDPACIDLLATDTS